MGVSKRQGDSRARTRENADAGVSECVSLMTSGQWVSGRSHAEVARRHGVAESTARDWATNASRIVRLAVQGDVEEIRARMVATLETVATCAIADEDWRTVVSAVAEQAKLLGMVVQKHEVSAMTPEEADRLIAEAAKLAKEDT